MRLFAIIVLWAALVPGAASAGEYHIYKDSGGSVVLSNLATTQRPADRAPESLALVRSYEWPEATAEDISKTETENREAARISMLRDLALQAERLADEMRRSNEIALAALREQALRPSTEINQVIVAGHRFGRFRGR
jgi:hypothetical protein